MQIVQPREVQVTAIHDVEGAGFEAQQVQHIHICHLAVADVDEDRDGPAQVEQVSDSIFHIYSYHI